MYQHSKTEFAKMAKMIALDTFRKLSFYFNFEIRNLNVFQLMETIFGSVFVNPIKIDDSITLENWPRFNIVSHGNFTLNITLVPCI